MQYSECTEFENKYVNCSETYVCAYVYVFLKPKVSSFSRQSEYSQSKNRLDSGIFYIFIIINALCTIIIINN